MTTTDTSTETDAPESITYSGFEGRAARRQLGEKAAIVLDPEDRSVWIMRSIGSGVPAKVWHRRAVTLSIDADASLESAEAALRENEEAIAKIFAMYEGKTWDGNNHVGEWSDDPFVFLDMLETALAEVGSYWDAWDYLAPVANEIAESVAVLVRTGVRPAVAIELVAQKELDSSDEAILDLADLESTITRMYLGAVEKVLLAHDFASVDLGHRDVGSILTWIGSDAGLVEVSMAALCLDDEATGRLAEAYFESDDDGAVGWSAVPNG